MSNYINVQGFYEKSDNTKIAYIHTNPLYDEQVNIVIGFKFYIINIPINESAKMAPRIGVKYARTVKPWKTTDESVSEYPSMLLRNRTKIALIP